MKKCSPARINRRLQKKEFIKENKTMLKTNKCWDELHMLHAGTVALLFSTKNITPLLRNEEAMAKLNRDEINQIVSLITKDLEHYKNRIDAIYLKHQKKSGGSDDPNILFECIGYSQEYIAISESFNMIVAPNIDRILTMFEEVNKVKDVADIEAPAEVAEQILDTIIPARVDKSVDEEPVAIETEVIKEDIINE